MQFNSLEFIPKLFGIITYGVEMLIPLFFCLMGIVMVGNALWMGLFSLHWFDNIPADLVATGAPNVHFIHDVALAYFVFGVGIFWCASHLQNCRPVFLGVSLFSAGHAINHVIEILIGQLPHSHWWIDFPLVFLPGLLMAILALPKVWEKFVVSGAEL